MHYGMSGMVNPYYTVETPEGQYHYEAVLRRQADILWRDASGERQNDIAREYGVSQSRAHQLLKQAKKHRQQGLV